MIKRSRHLKIIIVDGLHISPITYLLSRESQPPPVAHVTFKWLQVTGSTYRPSPIFFSRESQPPPVALSATACPFEFRRPYKYCLPAFSSSPLTTVALAHLRSHNCSR